MDSLEGLKLLERERVNCVITSPPYYGLRRYSNNKLEIGNEEHPQLYINKIVEITIECMRVIKQDGVMFLNLGDSYASHRSGKDAEVNISSEKKLSHLVTRNAPKKALKSNWFQEKQKLLIPHRIAIALQEKGFLIRDDIVWTKKVTLYPQRESIGSTMPFPVVDKCLPATEYIFQIVKNKKYFYNLSEVRNKIKDATFQRVNYPLSSTYSIQDENNPYIKQGKSMDNYYNKLKENYIDDDKGARRTRTKMNLCVGKEGYTNWNVKIKKNYIGPNDKEYCIGNIRSIDVEEANPTNAIMFKKNFQSIIEDSEHFAVFPESLAEFFIKVGCPKEGIVLDPFVGSGTTCLVAKRLGRNYIGFDLKQEYVDMANKRLQGFKAEDFRAEKENKSLNNFTK